MFPITNLPAEIQLSILDNISASGLIALRQASRYWCATIDQCQDRLINRILKQDVALWHNFFEVWNERFGSHIMRERAVAAVLESQQYEADELEPGVYQEDFLPEETLEWVPWDLPFLKPGRMILPFETYKAHFVERSWISEQEVAVARFSSYLRPEWYDFTILCKRTDAKIASSKLAYLSFLATLEERHALAMESAMKSFRWTASTEVLSQWVFLHFITSLTSPHVLRRQFTHKQKAAVEWRVCDLANRITKKDRATIPAEFTIKQQSTISSMRAFVWQNPAGAVEDMVDEMCRALQNMTPRYFGYKSSKHGHAAQNRIREHGWALDAYYNKELKQQSDADTDIPSTTHSVICALSERLREKRWQFFGPRVFRYDHGPRLVDPSDPGNPYSLFNTHFSNPEFSLDAENYNSQCRVGPSEDLMLDRLFGDAPLMPVTRGTKEEQGGCFGMCSLKAWKPCFRRSDIKYFGDSDDIGSESDGYGDDSDQSEDGGSNADDLDGDQSDDVDEDDYSFQRHRRPKDRVRYHDQVGIVKRKPGWKY